MKAMLGSKHKVYAAPGAAEADADTAKTPPPKQQTNTEIESEKTPKNDDAVLNINEGETDGAKPSIEKAEEYRNQTCPRLKNEGRMEKYDIVMFDDFGQFGTGVLLYFQLLKKLSLCFGVLFLFSIPQLLISASIDAYHSTGIQADRIMLGALGSPNIKSVQIPFVDITLARETFSIYIVGMDAFIAVCFVYFLLRLESSQEKEAKESDSFQITASDFTVRVKGLPKDQNDRQEILEFFQERWGKVADVAMYAALVLDSIDIWIMIHFYVGSSCNDADLIDLYLQRGRIKYNIVSLKRKGKESDVLKAFEKINKIDEKIEKFKQNYTIQAVECYVSFDTVGSQVACLKAYQTGFFSRFWPMKKNLKFKDRRLSVSAAPEPSNILFTNLKYSERSRLFRRFITFFSTVMVMVISLSLVFIATNEKKELTGETRDCHGLVVDRAEALAHRSNSTLVECFCAGVSTQLVIHETDLCSVYIANLFRSKILTGVVAATILIVNFFLKTSVIALVKWEKHSSLSSQEKAITLKLFIGLFTNTGIIMLLVNGNLRRYVGNFGSSFGLFEGSHADITAEWYQDVGVSILITMLLNTVNPHIVPVIMIGVKALKRRCLRSRMTTQKQLNDLYSGEDFVMSDRYASMLNIVFVSLLYSSGIPALLLTASLTFMLTYVFDKIALIRLYKYPPMLDESLAVFAARLMRYAIIFHSAMAVWVFSYDRILTSYPTSGRIGKIASYIFDGELLQIVYRIEKLNALPPLAIFMATFGQKILSNLPCVLLCFKCCRSRSKVAAELNEDEDQTYLQALTQGMRIESYHLHAQPRYQDAFMRTTSKKMLQAVPFITEELKEARQDPRRRKRKKRKRPKHATSNMSLNGLANGGMSSMMSSSALDKFDTAQFLDDNGMITVQCPTCENHTNVMHLGKRTRYSCPWCSTIFQLES